MEVLSRVAPGTQDARSVFSRYDVAQSGAGISMAAEWTTKPTGCGPWTPPRRTRPRGSGSPWSDAEFASSYASHAIEPTAARSRRWLDRTGGRSYAKDEYSPSATPPRRLIHHHHKYLPNRPRQSRQEQAPRRPTRPRPRASPTRRRRTPPPRQSPRRPRPPRAPARGAPRPARRWPRVFRPRS